MEALVERLNDLNLAVAVTTAILGSFVVYLTLRVKALGDRVDDLENELGKLKES